MIRRSRAFDQHPNSATGPPVGSPFDNRPAAWHPDSVIPQAVILLGGKGTRIAERFPDRPKCLVPVAGRPFLEWQFDWLKQNGVVRILLAAGHMADVLEAYLAAREPGGLEIVLSREPRPLGTGGALKFVEPQLASDPVLVVNGDSLTPNLDFSTVWKIAECRAQADRHGANARSIAPRTCAASEGAPATAAATDFHSVEKMGGIFHGVEKSFPQCGKLFVAPIEDPGRFGTVEFGADGFVTAFREKAERSAGFVNTGLYLLPREILAAIPAGQAVSLETEIFPALAAERRLVAIPIPPPLLDMGTPDGLAAMEAFLRGGGGTISSR